MTHAFWLGLLLGAATLAQTPSDIPETYVVQPGDTCMGIAKKFFGSTSEYSRVHALNELGPLPHNLKPGTVVRLRAKEKDEDKASFPSDAVLAAFSATVNIRGATLREWTLAQPHQPLFRLDEVHTHSGASADILFKDSSMLRMKQNALIIIYGGASSKVRFRHTAGIQLLEGELGVSLADLRKPPAAIVTPSAEISMRAKEAIIDVDTQQTSRVSVQDGEAKITAQGKSVKLKSGQGTRVKKDAAPEPPMPLPQPPTWVDSRLHELHAVHGAHKATVLVQWTAPPSQGPGLWRVEVAKDASFQNLLLETTTQALQHLLPELAPGTFYARVRALNEAGLISSPSPTKRLDILKVGEEDSTSAEMPGGVPKVRGKTPLFLSEGLPEDIHIFVDGVQVESPGVIEHPGIYLAEFKTADGKQSVGVEVEASPPEFTLEADPEPPAPTPAPAPALEAGEKTLDTPFVQPLAILRERRLGSLALPSSHLVRGFQLNTALDMDFSQWKAGVLAARLTARVDGPFPRGSYFLNSTLVNYLGSKDSLVYPEVAAGAHMQFPITKHWTTGMAADLSGNLKAHRAKEEIFLRLRAMGILGYQTKAFTVSTTQGVAGERANFLHAAWIGSISASWHVRPKFLLAAQWDGQKTARRGFASAAAAGFRFLVGPAEMGVTGHAGLTSEGRSQWGDYGASLTLAIR